MAFVGRFFDPPAQSFFLFGPRGTGKSAWTQRRYPGAVRIDLLHPATQQRFRARPERLFEVVRAEPAGRVIVIDEVQRVPELLSATHALIEEGRDWRFVLTGSSARKLRRSGVDLMAGRAVVRTMHPFMAAELGDAFDLPAALQRGMLPLVLGAADPLDTLQGYLAVYVREEVQMEGLVRNLDGFSRFLETVCFSHGQLLNVSNIARDSSVSRKAVEGYLSVIEDLLLSFRLPVFRKRAARATVAHDKFYLFDCGVFRGLRPAGPLDRPKRSRARHWKGWSPSTCGRGWPTATAGERLYYWRTRAGSEVDFIIYGPDQFIAIEVKHSATVRRSDLHALRSFHDDYPEAQRLLLYLGDEQLHVDGVQCMPCEAVSARPPSAPQLSAALRVAVKCPRRRLCRAGGCQASAFSMSRFRPARLRGRGLRWALTPPAEHDLPGNGPMSRGCWPRG